MSPFRMTLPYYKAIFLSTTKPDNAEELMLIALWSEDQFRHEAMGSTKTVSISKHGL